MMGTLLAGLLAAAGALAAPADGKPEVVKAVGVVTAIELREATDKRPEEAVVTLKVKGKELVVVVRDEVTLKKFKVKKIGPEDEVKVQYVLEGEENVTRLFRKTAGC